MRYAVNQKIGTLTEGFSIKDEEGEVIYKVKGKMMSMGNHLVVSDPDGNKVADIKERLMTMYPTYDITCEDGPSVEIYKKSLALKKSYVITIDGDEKLEGSGSFIRNDYQIARGKSAVAKISKKILAFADSYGVDVSDGEHDLSCLCCAVVIDMLEHGNGK